MLSFLGAEGQVAAYFQEYYQIMLLELPVMVVNSSFGMFIRGEGSPRYYMKVSILSVVLNILLDPLFIFVLQLNVKGAALATIISQGVSACWVVGFLCSPGPGCASAGKISRLERAVVGKIAALGVAPFIMQSTESLVTVVLNSGLQHYGGDLYVGTSYRDAERDADGGDARPGVTQGVQPIMSYNYGAKNYRRVREVFRLLLRTTLTVTVTSFLIVILFPRPLALIFNDNRELVELVGRVMPIFFGGIWAFGAQMACQSAFMAMGQAKTSLFLALLRKIILLIPLIFILPQFLADKVFAVWLAEPVADILAAATTGIMFARRFPKILKRREEELEK